MRVLFLYNLMDLPETMLVCELVKRGLEADVMCNTTDGQWQLLSQQKIAVQPLICRSRLDFRAIAEIRKKASSGRYDIIHAFTSKLLAVTNLALLGLSSPPQVVAYRGAMGNVGRLLPASWITYLHPQLRAVNCVSDAVAKDLRERGVLAAKVIRIYKGHDVAWYDGAETAVRKELGIPENAFLVACTANMRSNKGVDLLVRSVNRLADVENIHLLLIGSISQKEISNLRSSISINHRLHILGYRPDAWRTVCGCDLFVMPSRFREGLPKAVIEAMSLRVPVIVSRIGGMPELVRNEIDGLVVDPCSEEALADAILRVYSDDQLRGKLGIAGRERISDAFNIRQTVEETLLLYQAVEQAGREGVRSGQRRDICALLERLRLNTQ